jgi:hypothetical protein
MLLFFNHMSLHLYIYIVWPRFDIFKELSSEMPKWVYQLSEEESFGIL